MEFAQGDKVAFVVRGFRIEGTVARAQKSDGKIPVNAPTLYRMSDGTPLLDMTEEMLWDVPPSALERIQATTED
jgi:hypothetical protein